MLYPIVIEPGDKDTAYSVVIPDIPGCYAAGDTLEEAVRDAHEAMHAHFELLAEDKSQIPHPSAIEAHRTNKAYDGWIWMLADIDVTVYQGKSEKINVTLPELLIKKIDDKVAKEPAYKSRSGFLAEAAWKALKSA
jgi:predicted RNase H-like HicB family nuclease